MPRWKIYYKDGSTFSSEDGSPAEAPGRGVLVIGVADRFVGLKTLSGRDYYGWSEDEQTWYALNKHGLLDFLGEPGWVTIKQGRMCNRHTWESVWKAVKLDSFLPKKTGYAAGEERHEPWVNSH